MLSIILLETSLASCDLLNEDDIVPENSQESIRPDLITDGEEDPSGEGGR